MHYTKNPLKYGLRLFVCMIISEIAFDYALFGMISWDYQNVMVALLIGLVIVWILIGVYALWDWSKKKKLKNH